MNAMHRTAALFASTLILFASCSSPTRQAASTPAAAAGNLGEALAIAESARFQRTAEETKTYNTAVEQAAVLWMAQAGDPVRNKPLTVTGPGRTYTLTSSWPENLLFESATPPSQAIGMDFAATRQLMVEGSAWTVRLRPTAAFSQPSSPAIPLMLGLFGLLFAGAIALVARYQSRAYDAISLLQEAGEKSLVEKDLMLQEMKHRIKNSIARVLAIARQTASNSKDVAEFSSSFAARLQAMAASQDMLTRSRWQKADLEELLRIELGQVFGKELPAGILSGPKLLLSETETQALGLTFHELATNALKYGEAGSSQDALRVRWSRNGKNMVLVWTEVGKKVMKPEKTGFGTKLIDMNIKLELNGTISRSYGDDGIQIVIEVPLAAGED